MSEADQRRAEQAAEYGKYRANQNIYVGGALAYLAGHPVPVSNVENGSVPVDAVSVVQEQPAPPDVVIS